MHGYMYTGGRFTSFKLGSDNTFSVTFQPALSFRSKKRKSVSRIVIVSRKENNMNESFDFSTFLCVIKH